VGSLQIRNVATLGGNLAQHSRCWYYRHRDIHCLKKGGDTCYARNGENKYHCIFSGTTCISPVVSNMSIALAALEANVIVQRGKKTLRLSIPDFYAKAWDNPTVHHSLNYGDLILKVEVPTTSPASAYLQISEKASFDWALVSCAAAASMDGPRIKQARVFLGQVAARILRKATPMSFNGYKVPIAQALIQRTLLKLKA
jgi:xanthine dehydrogenase YagS FAD-binding subunit